MRYVIETATVGSCSRCVAWHAWSGDTAYQTERYPNALHARQEMAKWLRTVESERIARLPPGHHSS